MEHRRGERPALDQTRPLLRAAVEDRFGAYPAEAVQGAEWPLLGRQRPWNVGPKRQNWTIRGSETVARGPYSGFAALRYSARLKTTLAATLPVRVGGLLLPAACLARACLTCQPSRPCCPERVQLVPPPGPNAPHRLFPQLMRCARGSGQTLLRFPHIVMPLSSDRGHCG
jgi:hypothetical protein